MTERRNPGCAFGPCNDSKQVGGAGCYLCDVIAKLPQPRRLGGPVIQETPEGGVDDETSLKLSSEPTTKKAKKATAPRKSKSSGQSGRLW